MRANFVLSGVASGLRRNVLMTVALVLTTAISLGFLGAALLTNQYIDRFNKHYQSKLSVQLYLCPPAIPQATDAAQSTCTGKYTAAQKAAIDKALTSDPTVQSHTFINETEALARAKQLLGDDLVANAGANTFPASFQVKLKNISRDFNAFKQKYGAMSGVQKVQSEDEGLKVILKLFDGARLFSIIVAVVIMICSAILVSMTIQVAAAQRRTETGIMRLVGASRWMTQLPFIIETIIATVAGGILALILLGIGRWFLLGNMLKTQVHNQVLPNLGLGDVIVWGGVGALAGIVLAGVISYTTLRLYVRL